MVIGNCLDSFPPIFFIYLKIFVTFSYFWVIFFYIFRDKIRIWSQEKLMTIAWFSSDYAEFFFTYSSVCSVIICDVSCCFSRSSSVNGAKIQTSYFWYFNSNGGKSIEKCEIPHLSFLHRRAVPFEFYPHLFIQKGYNL